MKCRCCDKEISDKEIQFNPELISRYKNVDDPGMFEDCPSCYQQEMEAAYEGGFAYDEEDEDVVVLEDFDDYKIDFSFDVVADEEYE